MGWNVYAHEYVAHIAVCGEYDCPFKGTPGLADDQVDQEVEAHWRWHDEEWNRANDLWERNLPYERATPPPPLHAPKPDPTAAAGGEGSVRP